MQTGWIDIPDEIYHNSPEFIYTMTSSGLKQMARSPEHWHTWRTSPPSDPSQAMYFGSCFHGHMLGTNEIWQVPQKLTFPKLLEAKNLLGPKSVVLPVNAADYENLEGMKQKLISNELSFNLLNHPSAIYECSGFFIDPDYGIIGSVKPDIRIPDLGIIVDLKTTVDAAQIAFPRSIRRYHYDWQAWWYLRGANALSHGEYDTFIIIAIEKVPPYGLNVFQIMEGLFYADLQVRPLLDKFETCLAADRWPGYPADEIIQL